MIILMFSVYAVRFLGHSSDLLAQPYWCFLLEMFKPLGNNLAMVTGTHFILANSDNTNIASLEVSTKTIFEILILFFYTCIIRAYLDHATLVLEKLLESLLEVLLPILLDIQWLGK